MSRGVLYSTICIVTAILFVVVAKFWVFERPPVRMKKLEAIKRGATREEVQSAIGKPTNVYEENRKWAYSKPTGWSIVYVYFDEQGRFEKYDYDY